MAKGFTYQLDINANIQNVETQLKNLKTALSTALDTKSIPDLEKLFDKIEQKLISVKTKASTPIKSEGAFQNILQDLANIGVLAEKANGKLTDLKSATSNEKIKLLPEADRKKFEGIIDAISKYTDVIKEASQETDELIDARKKLEATSKKLKSKETDVINLEATKKAAEATKDLAQQKVDQIKTFQDAAKAAEKERAAIEKLAKAAKEKDPSIDLRSATFDAGNGAKTLAKVRAEAAAAAAKVPAQGDIDKANRELSESNQIVANITKKYTAAVSAVQTLRTEEASLTQQVAKLNQQFKTDQLTKSQQAFDELRQKAQQLGINLNGIGTDNSQQNVDLLKQRLQECIDQGLEPLNQGLDEGQKHLTNLGQVTEGTSQKVKESAQDFREQSEAAGDIQGILNRTKALVGFGGAINLMRKAARAAFNDVKELDAQMTEMAVVTNQDIGAYWKQLPEHTARAKQLGVAIKDVYEAETLYYQQGLKVNEVTALSNATLKMARIAGLSAEDATNKMTAA